MKFVEYNQNILNKIKRSNLAVEQFEIDRNLVIGEMDLDDVWADAFIAYCGAKFPELNEKRIDVLSKTKSDYSEYFKMCDEIISKLSNRLALKKFSDALFSIASPVIATKKVITAFENNVPSQILVDACNMFVDVFAESPEPIKCVVSYEKTKRG